MYGFASENPSTDSCVLDEEQRLLAAARGGCQRTLVNAMEAVGRINYRISLIQTQHTEHVWRTAASERV